MSYETVAAVTQTASLLIFLALFVVVLGYVFWPRTAEKLEKGQRQALDLDISEGMPGGRS